MKENQFQEFCPPGSKSLRGCNSATSGFCFMNFHSLIGKRSKINEGQI